MNFFEVCEGKETMPLHQFDVVDYDNFWENRLECRWHQLLPSLLSVKEGHPSTFGSLRNFIEFLFFFIQKNNR